MWPEWHELGEGSETKVGPVREAWCPAGKRDFIPSAIGDLGIISQPLC